LESKLSEGEVIVKTLGEGWHAVRHGEKIEWFKTAYKRKLFRKPVLTNQRLVFLNNEDIDYEIPLEDIVQTTSKRYLRLGTPYLRLELKNGNIIHIVFENISQRVLDAIFAGGYAEDANQIRLVKAWADEINLHVKEMKTRQLYKAKIFPPPPPPTPATSPICPGCGHPLTLIQQYNRWYCYNCRKYS